MPKTFDEASHAAILERIDGLRILTNERFVSQDSLIRELHVKVDKTNGRVSTLERWRSYIFGALAILTTLILPLLFMIATELLSRL